MLITETDERFYIDNSTIPNAGKGLFTKVKLVPGDRLKVVGVLVVTDSIIDQCTYYADKYKFRVGEALLIPLGYGAMVNHSSSPNMEKIIEGRTVYLQALSTIAKGEELFICYSGYAQHRWGLE